MTSANTPPVDPAETEDTMTATVNDTVTDAERDDENEPVATKVAKRPAPKPPVHAPRAISVRTLVRSLVAGVLVIGVVVGFVVLGLKVRDQSRQIDAMTSAQADNAKAEQVALDYAVGAAAWNYQDFDGWAARLTKGTSPELSERLKGAATQMQQVMAPIQWVSTATPIAATVLPASKGDTFEVACFVNVVTKNVQSPDGAPGTATYKLTLDRSKNWQITAITSVGSPLEQSAPK